MDIVNFVKISPSDDLNSRKKTHKLPPEAVRIILDLTVAGLSNTVIQSTVAAIFGFTIHTNLIGYYRKKYAEELKVRYCEEIAKTRHAFPELATLPGRIKFIDDIIKNELAKGEKCSAFIIVSAVKAADTMMNRAGQLVLTERRTKEEEAKQDDREAILQLLELRSHVDTMVAG